MYFVSASSHCEVLTATSLGVASAVAIFAVVYEVGCRVRMLCQNAIQGRICLAGSICHVEICGVDYEMALCY